LNKADLNEKYLITNEEISLDELKKHKSYEHERAHIKIWQQYGVKVSIVRHKVHKWVGVLPRDFQEKYRNKTK